MIGDCYACGGPAVQTAHGNMICTGCGYFESRCVCDPK
jgi:hypothetical protein